MNRSKINTLKQWAREANAQGKYDLVGFYLEKLEPLIPLGDKYDEFQAFCTELEQTANQS